MISVTKNGYVFSAELLLGPSKYTILPFRKLCQKFGSDGTIITVSSKNDIVFDKKEIVVAYTEKKTLLKSLDEHEAVKAIYIPESLVSHAKDVCKKPLISSKGADITITGDSSPKGDLILKITKQQTPEDFNSLLTKTDSKALVISEIAISQPVIFEQTKNYFEKGYYNKITRKKREKTLEEFEKLCVKFPSDEVEIIRELKQLFITD